ncbi:helix-turn-helix transcriptional regulator [Halothiobacillus sp.]|uniref:helix-turn-helix domain-containing protein n=1 Tax=Halothiobacillus sp. TaxID=1891311 RepID=UPI00260E3F60|nr:helix-turn-helix transcriptional regulator [Halothiobacillus sp.]
MNVQVIERNGSPEWAVLPYAEYERLISLLESMQDVAEVTRVHAALERGEEEAIPDEVVERLLAGESPLRVWREYRGLSQIALAESAQVTQGMVTMIETGKRKGQAMTLKRLAEVLRIDVDDLL